MDINKIKAQVLREEADAAECEVSKGDIGDQWSAGAYAVIQGLRERANELEGRA